MFKSKIKELRKKNNLTQEGLAKLLNVERSTITKWESGAAKPTADKLKTVANIFQTTIDVLLQDDENVSEVIKISILNDVISKEKVGTLDIPKDPYIAGDYFALEVKDDSMSPRLLPADIIIVRYQSNVRDGDFAVLDINGNEFIRKVIKLRDGIKLMPLNQNYEQHSYSNDELLSIPINIVGRLVELRGKF